MITTHELEVTPKCYLHYYELHADTNCDSCFGLVVNVLERHHLPNYWNHFLLLDASLRHSFLFFRGAGTHNFNMPMIVAMILKRLAILRLSVSMYKVECSARMLFVEFITRKLRKISVTYLVKYSETFAENLFTPNKPMYIVP